MRGRRILVPRRGTRPTQDMVREALFSMLAEKVPGSTFLDLYAGSGSVGLDAWSRGAAKVVFVEKNRSALKLLKQNAETAGDGLFVFMCMDARAFIRKPCEAGQFDIIFADPPYEQSDKGCKGACSRMLESVRESGILGDNGVFIIEQYGKAGFCEHEGWELAAEKRYGHAGIGIYKRSE